MITVEVFAIHNGATLSRARARCNDAVVLQIIYQQFEPVCILNRVECTSLAYTSLVHATRMYTA